MKFINNKFFMGLICFAAGATAMFGFQKLQTKTSASQTSRLTHTRSIDPLFDQFFNENFFETSRNPFDEIRRMRERMLKDFDQIEGGSIFDSWYDKKFGGGTVNEIKQREDDNFVYYDITIDGLKQEKVNIEVMHGQLSISGKVEKKSKGENTNSYFSSSFQRSFPIPSNVDADQMQMEQAKDKIVIKFPKLPKKNN